MVGREGDRRPPIDVSRGAQEHLARESARALQQLMSAFGPPFRMGQLTDSASVGTHGLDAFDEAMRAQDAPTQARIPAHSPSVSARVTSERCVHIGGHVQPMAPLLRGHRRALLR